MRDFLWGPDVGWFRSLARMALKIVIAVLVAKTIHEGLVNKIFSPDPEVLQLSKMQD
jgi:hypothetical protein